MSVCADINLKVEINYSPPGGSASSVAGRSVPPDFVAVFVAGVEVWNHYRMQNPLAEFFSSGRNVGEATAPRFRGRTGSFQCGATVQVSLHIDETQRITDAKFKAAGCSVLVASASLLVDAVTGKTTAEAATLAQRPDMLMGQLGELRAGRSECPALACEALVAAIRNYSDSARDEWEGDEALVCTCFCVSERTIETEIHAHSLKTIAEVTAACNAGAGCRSCYPLIEDILEEVNGKW